MRFCYLGPHLGHLGPPFGHLASHLGHLGPHLGHLGPHLEHFGPHLGHLGLHLGPQTVIHRLKTSYLGARLYDEIYVYIHIYICFLGGL